MKPELTFASCCGNCNNRKGSNNFEMCKKHGIYTHVTETCVDHDTNLLSIRGIKAAAKNQYLPDRSDWRRGR